jgi:ketopantoate hydroxymethyltransferase
LTDSGASRPLVITDMPFGTCEGTPFEALKNAQRLMKVRDGRGAGVENSVVTGLLWLVCCRKEGLTA